MKAFYNSRILSIFRVIFLIIITISFAIQATALSSFPDLNYSTLLSTRSFSLRNNELDSRFARKVETGIDLNNDGFGDLLIGADGFNNSAGAVFVVFGNSSGFGDLQLDTASSLSATGRGFTITGPQTNAFFGFSISAAGDFNGDGIDDIIVGAYLAKSVPGSSNYAGIVYVIFGGNRTFHDINLSRDDLLTLGQGLKIVGYPQSYFGYSVGRMGDLNHDGADDVILGAPFHGTSFYSEYYYVAYGLNANLTSIVDISVNDIIGSVGYSNRGFMIKGSDSSTIGFGQSETASVDLNNDTELDLAVASSSGLSPAVFVIYGSAYNHVYTDLTKMNLAGLNQGFKILGKPWDLLGTSMTNADLNYDGVKDLIIGAPGNDSVSNGTVYVIFGNSSISGDIDLNTIDLYSTYRGFKIVGTGLQNIGFSVANAGDLNQDGIDDIIIGTKNHGTPLAYVIFGTKSRPTDIDLSITNLTASNRGFRVVGGEPNTACGTSVSHGFDFNKDGITDIVIGASCSTSQAVYIILQQRKDPDLGSNSTSNPSSSSASNPKPEPQSESKPQPRPIKDIESLQTTTGSTKKASTVITTIGSIFCINKALALSVGFISKLIQNIRFININYSAQLQTVFQTWSTSLLNINIPDHIDNQLASEGISTIFTEYGIDPSFLANFWETLMTLLIALAIYIVLRLIASGSGSCLGTYSQLFNSVMKWFADAIRNFLIVSLYESIGDVMFFSVLEFKSLLLTTGWSRFSFLLSIFCLIAASCLIALHLKFLYRYHALKNGPPANSSQAIQDLRKRFRVLQVLYDDFKDTTLFKHGFMFTLVFRDVFIALVMTTMTPLPLLQSLLFGGFSLTALICLTVNNPFEARIDRISQGILELMVFITSICVLILANMSSNDQTASVQGVNLGLTIIYINIILNCSSVIVMILKILEVLKEIYHGYCGWKNRRTAKVMDASTLNESSQIPIVNISSTTKEPSNDMFLRNGEIKTGISRDRLQNSQSRFSRSVYPAPDLSANQQLSPEIAKVEEVEEVLEDVPDIPALKISGPFKTAKIEPSRELKEIFQEVEHANTSIIPSHSNASKEDYTTINAFNYPSKNIGVKINSYAMKVQDRRTLWKRQEYISGRLKTPNIENKSCSDTTEEQKALEINQTKEPSYDLQRNETDLNAKQDPTKPFTYQNLITDGPKASGAIQTGELHPDPQYNEIYSDAKQNYTQVLINRDETANHIQPPQTFNSEAKRGQILMNQESSSSVVHEDVNSFYMMEHRRNMAKFDQIYAQQLSSSNK